MRRIEVFNAHRKHRVRSPAVIRYVRRVLTQEGQRKAVLSVIFIDSKASRAINRRYLGHDYATDVLSFCMQKGTNLEGEMYVNLDRARQQARAFKVSVANEVARLVIHGTLHLVGYDDSTAIRAKKMKVRQEEHVQFWFRKIEPQRRQVRKEKIER